MAKKTDKAPKGRGRRKAEPGLIAPPPPIVRPEAAPKVKALTAGQRDYLTGLSAGLTPMEAADKAGISLSLAYKLNQRDEFKAALEEQRQANAEAHHLQLTRLLHELCRVAFVNAADFYDDRMNIKPVSTWTPAMRAAVKEIEVFEEWTGIGDDRVLEGFTKKLKFHDKLKAMDSLRELLGLGAAPKAPVGPDGKPVQQIAGYIVVPAKDALPEAKPGDVIEGHLENVRTMTG